MTNHDLAGAARTCHRVELMNTVVAEGGPELLADPDQVLQAFGSGPAHSAPAELIMVGVRTGSGPGCTVSSWTS
ncbi:hypothetical protein [Streptomyces sp. NPDC093591]|uniref:hypothetical protein n=1 Tax=Streptomyces sp. NPDC093591 TaxID=3366044 RepID=UPI0037FE674D